MEDLQNCQLCSRLSAYRAKLKRQYPDYHCAPVSAFGPPHSRLLVIGLAPGLHGANASGRPFTGDASGDLLFSTLHRYGFSSQPDSRSPADDLRLIDCRVTNAVKCVPPQNLPQASERNNCNRYLAEEIDALPRDGVIFTLGGIAHRMAIRSLGLRQAEYPFAHDAQFQLPDGLRLLASYHPSRYNINTGMLTARGFAQVVAKLRRMLP